MHLQRRVLRGNHYWLRFSRATRASSTTSETPRCPQARTTRGSPGAARSAPAFGACAAGAQTRRCQLGASSATQCYYHK